MILKLKLSHDSRPAVPSQASNLGLQGSSCVLPATLQCHLLTRDLWMLRVL